MADSDAKALLAKMLGMKITPDMSDAQFNTQLQATMLNKFSSHPVVKKLQKLQHKHEQYQKIKNLISKQGESKQGESKQGESKITELGDFQSEKLAENLMQQIRAFIEKIQKVFGEDCQINLVNGNGQQWQQQNANQVTLKNPDSAADSKEASKDGSGPEKASESGGSEPMRMNVTRQLPDGTTETTGIEVAPGNAGEIEMQNITSINCQPNPGSINKGVELGQESGWQGIQAGPGCSSGNQQMIGNACQDAGMPFSTSPASSLGGAGGPAAAGGAEGAAAGGGAGAAAGGSEMAQLAVLAL